MSLNPYLMFNGQCEQAFKTYAQILGGKIVSMMPHEGTPAESQVPPEWRKKIIHARMTIGDDVLMGSDAPPAHQKTPQGFSVSLNVESASEAERIFAALAKGGTITMPIAKTFWAIRFGMLVDQYGIPWMINCEEKAPEHRN